MIQICRAEDGQIYKVNASLRDIERTGSLELFLHQETGVDQEAILAYLSDGRRLTNNNIRELAGSQDQSIFVFNKFYLDFDLDDVLRELRVEAPLQPPIEDVIAGTPPFRPTQLATSYLRTAHTHHEFVAHTLSALRYQHEAIRIASTSLDLNVLAIVDTFESIALNSRKELERQDALLSGVEADLDIISKVRVHVEFVSPAVRHAIEAGEKPRTLGDYVSNVKMKQVAETCARTHDDLRSRFVNAEMAVSTLNGGTDSVRATASNISLITDAEACVHRSQDILNKIIDKVSMLDGPEVDSNALLRDLRQLDIAHRDELRSITDVKNAYTEQCIGVLRRISVLNNDMVQIPPALSSLQASFRAKTSFSHVQRLHNMLYAYGATVIEVVRRKEFSRFFYQRAQSILEVMAKLSSSERKRRQVYRGEIYGQLPFETRGMDDSVPTIDFSPSGNPDATYSLEREDIDGLLRVLDDIEKSSQSSNDLAALSAVQECRAALDKLIVRMDGLEAGFDRIAERSLLSASRLSSSRRRLNGIDEQDYQKVVEQLRAVEQSKSHQERVFYEEKNGLQEEINHLKSNFQDAVSGERERADRLERELHQAHAQLSSETTARQLVEDRNSELLKDIETQHKALADALADATDHAHARKMLEQELAQVRAEFEEVKSLEERNAAKVANLLSDQVITLRNLEEARFRGEDLESQIQAARTECDDVNRALKEATKEKDRLLRLQANEHDRIIRDHRAEADGDRAVLEHQFSELREVKEHIERQLQDARVEIEVANADAVGLREELQRVEHELREARHAERVLREDLNAGRASQSDFEQRLENSSRLVAQILDVALAFRTSHVKAMNSAHVMNSHPNSKPSTSLAESAFLSAMRSNLIGQPDEPSPIDPSDPPSALEALRAFDHDHFLEVLGKTGSTIRKWQKQCKEYRERAKGKISFRNFAKGDLALFLPTRNSVSKPWAAFNVSFPHYFLQAMGHLAEQLKTREWIVARITSITERVVDHNDPSSNPYGLGDGVKYYMLEVEDWTQPSQPNKRRVSSRKIEKQADDVILSESPPSLPPGPLQAEVEDSFRVTRPPTSHLFPVRTRANTSPTAGPSSLSRLLAQAPVDSTLDPIPPSRSKTPSPTTSPPPPPSPSHHSGSAPHHVPGIPSPLRPGSRASRMSTSSSRFSVGRIPPLGVASSVASGTAKAAPTTALSEQPLLGSSSGETIPLEAAVTPLPDGFISEGMSNVLKSRRRTASYHLPRTSPLSTSSTSPNAETDTATGTPTQANSVAGATLANLASWGVSFGRKKKDQLPTLTTTIESPLDVRGRSDRIDSEPSARELLKRF